MIRISENPGACRKRSAFTLLEVLLSAVILAGLMILLLAMANRTFTLWGDGQRRREQQREAQSSLGMIGEDLRSAVIITDDDDSLLIRSEKDGDTLFFLVSHPDDRRQPGIKGDLCVAGYFTARAAGESRERNLYRFHASGDEVIQAVRERSLQKLYATATPGKANTELLARGIAELNISPAFPPHQGKPPEALRVTVTAMKRSDMQRMKENGPGEQSMESFLRKTGTSLSAVITIPHPREITRIR